jgi:hypothetical protein
MNKMTVRGTFEQFILASKQYRVVDRSRVDRVLGEIRQTTDDAVFDGDNAKGIGKMLAADYVCVLEMQKEQGYFSLDCSLIDVESGEIFGSASELIAADTPPEITKSAQKAARTMLELEDPEIEKKIAAAKNAVNRLAPNFEFKISDDKKRGRLVSCTSKRLKGYAKSRGEFFSASKKAFGYYILSAEIKDGELYATSQWTYRATDSEGNESYEGENYKIQPSKLEIEAGGRTAAVPLVSKRRIFSLDDIGILFGSALENLWDSLFDRGEKSKKASPGKSATTQMSPIKNPDAILRLIAASQRGQVRATISDEDGKSTVVDLAEPVKTAIAQTVELYDAIAHLRQAGVEIKTKYDTAGQSKP